MKRLIVSLGLSVASASAQAQHALSPTSVPTLEDGGLMVLVVVVGLVAGWLIKRGNDK